MAEGEELLGSGGVSTAEAVAPEKDATAEGVAKATAGGGDTEVEPGEPLLPLQDLLYYSSPLFPVVGAPEVVHGGDVPVEWSEKNIIAKAPESNPATSAPKRPRGKSPSSEDKPKKVRRQRVGVGKSKAGSPKPPVVAQSSSGVAQGTDPRNFRREGHDSGGTAADFGKLLFLALVSSCVSSADVLCSLGPIDEDIETAGESHTAAVTAVEATARAAGESVAGESSKESAGNDLDVIVTIGETVAGMPSQGQAASPTVHDAYHDKEPPEPQVESLSGAAKGMSLEEFLEKFAEDEENEKVVADFHPFLNDTVMFQRSEISIEGQPLLAAIIRKHPYFLAGCKLGASLRKSGLELLVAVLLDMQRMKLESLNLQRVLEWKSALKDLLFMKFRVQFILDKIRAAAEACITRDDEFLRKITDLEREIATKRDELALLLSQRDALMQSSSAGGVSSSEGTFGDGLFD
nr:hypothetical protein CFP56_35878 [Quercus suber]